ncbi:hypothetical protein DFH94DRAFT_118083 [Russula ochroleuca]|jgi:hypothetical protein|uniref:Uncharacterized protein n=1 Tax=Russula ochroleuca TaxID=152965 RepID=A0A9P5MQR5_9AGAM|nr:hypothetical protein DFH94DRAFT_118083 [Russula ochroleuca]
MPSSACNRDIMGFRAPLCPLNSVLSRTATRPRSHACASPHLHHHDPNSRRRPGVQQALEDITQHYVLCLSRQTRSGAARLLPLPSILVRAQPSAARRSTNPVVRRLRSAEPRRPRDCGKCRAGRGRHVACSHPPRGWLLPVLLNVTSWVGYGSQHRHQLISAKLLEDGKGAPRDLGPAGVPRTVSARMLRTLHRKRQTRSRGRTPTLSHQGRLVEP